MIAWAVASGYVLGSLPTANWIAGLWGVDLRSEGTGNPGANNARSLGGYPLALLVLGTELAKGGLAALVGDQLFGDFGAVLAGLAAVAGNVYNIWYRLEGGKGLGITAGVLLAVWPPAAGLLIFVMAAGTALTRSSGQGTLLTLGVSVGLAFAWAAFEWPNAWGVGDRSSLILFGVGLAVILFPKHFHDARHPVTEPFRP